MGCGLRPAESSRGARGVTTVATLASGAMRVLSGAASRSTWRRASAMSAPVSKRSAGCLPMARSSTSCRRGAALRTWAGRSGRLSFWMRWLTSVTLRPWKARSPATISNSMAPAEKMSDRPSTMSSPRHCSGDM